MKKIRIEKIIDEIKGELGENILGQAYYMAINLKSNNIHLIYKINENLIDVLKEKGFHFEVDIMDYVIAKKAINDIYLTIDLIK